MCNQRIRSARTQRTCLPGSQSVLRSSTLTLQTSSEPEIGHFIHATLQRTEHSWRSDNELGLSA